MATILVVDDELGIRDLLFEILNDEGHQVELAMNAAQARSVRASLQPDLVLLDIWMPDTDGITLLKEWAGSGQLTMPVVMTVGLAVSGHMDELRLLSIPVKFTYQTLGEIPTVIEQTVEGDGLGGISIIKKQIN